MNNFWDFSSNSIFYERIIQLIIFIIEATIVFTILGIIIYALYKLLRGYSLRKLEYKRYFSVGGAFEEQEIYLIEEFTNHSVLPMFRVDVETHITDRLYMPGVAGGREEESAEGGYQEFFSRFFVMPFTRIRRRHRVICMQRGCYRLESAKIRFMKIELYLDSRAELKVYPKELEIEDINRLNQCLQVTSVSRRPIMKDPFSFAGVREYGPGDAMNTINHKASARAGRLMVNESDFVMGRRMLLYINFQAGDTGIPVNIFLRILEKAMQYVSYMAGEALREGRQIGLRVNCRMEDGNHYLRIPLGTGYKNYIEILEGLACARTIFGNSIGYLMNMDIDEYMSGTEVVFFTTYTDESIRERIERMERMGNVVRVIDLKEVTAYEEDMEEAGEPVQ